MSKKIKKEYLIAILILLSITAGVLLFWKKQDSTKPAKVIYKEYEELENAYAKALSDIEKVSEKDYKNLDDMQAELKGKIKELKKNKELLDRSHKKSEELYKELAENIENLDVKKLDSLNKEEGEVVFNENEAGEIRYTSAEVDKIIKQNKELTKQKSELEKNLKTINTFFAKEKSKNTELKAQVEEINNKLSKAKTEKNLQIAELEQLRKERETYETKLKKSNNRITKQEKRIVKLIKNLRLVNVDCFYMYEKGNSKKEAKIFLTEDGLSEMYYNYFVQKKPNITAEFSLNQEMFNTGAEKVDLKVIDQEKIEVYSTSRTIGKSKFEIQIPGKFFNKGKYTIILKSGNENLIIDGGYTFKINK